MNRPAAGAKVGVMMGGAMRKGVVLQVERAEVKVQWDDEAGSGDEFAEWIDLTDLAGFDPDRERA